MNPTESLDRQFTAVTVEEQVRHAAKQHRALIPGYLPRLRGFGFTQFYCPCGPMGGDFYDYGRVGDALILLVADISGHGVSASLSTMLLRAVFHEAVRGGGDLVSMLAEMSERLYHAFPDGTYVCALLIQLEPNNHRIRLAGAGLPYPFHLRADEGDVRRIALPGTPLGLFSDRDLAGYEVREVSLAPGDVILAATDGLSSIQDADGRFFEDLHLPQILPRVVGSRGGAVIEAIAESALAHTQGYGFPDDVTLITIARELERDDETLALAS
jgi:sigma-B regulation protein RsbU (phosphoserine phosphatase)